MVFDLRGKVIFLATSNVHKFHEARMILSKHSIAVGMIRIKSLEIQSDRLAEIAETSVLDAFKKCNLPVIVEDAGLSIDALNGFPGPYAAYVYRTIGNGGLLRLMGETRNRTAKFESSIAYVSADLKSPMCFSGEALGEIVWEEKFGDGKSGFGFDPIFKPLNSDKTFAEMTLGEKNRRSHRASALQKFAEWYKKQ